MKACGRDVALLVVLVFVVVSATATQNFFVKIYIVSTKN
jgi:hypothetical protein